jgi:hypothetical protein
MCKFYLVDTLLKQDREEKYYYHVKDVPSFFNPKHA